MTFDELGEAMKYLEDNVQPLPRDYRCLCVCVVHDQKMVFDHGACSIVSAAF